MSLYFILNWLLTIFSSIALIWIYKYQRFLFVKPSILLLGCTNVFFQWPLAFSSEYYENLLPDPYSLLLLVHGYVLIGLIVSSVLFLPQARNIWNHLKIANVRSNVQNLQTVIIFLSLLILVSAWVYLSTVPFEKTGLYALIFNPSAASVARENSLKLLNDVGTKYIYSIAFTSIAPLLISIATILLILNKRLKNNFVVFFLGYLILTLCAGIFVSFSGARYGLMLLVLTVVLTFFWYKRLKIKYYYIILVILLALAPAIILSLVRENKSIFDFSLWGSYLYSVGYRAFVAPFEVGVWYVHYAQTYGPLGIKAFSKLALLAGIDPINPANFIGLQYAPIFLRDEIILPSYGADSGYLLTYYGYLGSASLFLSLLLLLCLDGVLLIISKLKDFLILPVVAVMSLITLDFFQEDYTTVLLTHGFAIIPIIAVILNFVCSSCRFEKKEIL